MSTRKPNHYIGKTMPLGLDKSSRQNNVGKTMPQNLDEPSSSRDPKSGQTLKPNLDRPKESIKKSESSKKQDIHTMRRDLDRTKELVKKPPHNRTNAPRLPTDKKSDSKILPPKLDRDTRPPRPHSNHPGRTMPNGPYKKQLPQPSVRPRNTGYTMHDKLEIIPTRISGPSIHPSRSHLPPKSNKTEGPRQKMQSKLPTIAAVKNAPDMKTRPPPPPPAKSHFTSEYDKNMASKQERMHELSPRERQEQEDWAWKKVNTLHPCVFGAPFVKIDGGFRCKMGTHLVTYELLAEGKGGCFCVKRKMELEADERRISEIFRRTGQGWINNTTENETWEGPYYTERHMKMHFDQVMQHQPLKDRLELWERLQTQNWQEEATMEHFVGRRGFGRSGMGRPGLEGQGFRGRG